MLLSFNTSLHLLIPTPISFFKWWQLSLLGTLKNATGYSCHPPGSQQDGMERGFFWCKPRWLRPSRVSWVVSLSQAYGGGHRETVFQVKGVAGEARPGSGGQLSPKGLWLHEELCTQVLRLWIPPDRRSAEMEKHLWDSCPRLSWVFGREAQWRQPSVEARGVFSPVISYGSGAPSSYFLLLLVPCFENTVYWAQGKWRKETNPLKRNSLTLLTPRWGALDPEGLGHL